MKIKNLRINVQNGLAYLKADVECCGFSEERQLWFSLPQDCASMFSDDVYDAFMVAALFPCMYYNEPMEIEGNVSKELYYNLTRYAHSIITAFRPEMKNININVSGFAVAKQSDKKVIGTGYSGGVDSFSTIVDHFVNEKEDDYKINHLFFFNLGQYGNPSNPESIVRAKNRYAYCKKATDEIGLPYTFWDTNLFNFYKSEWEHLSDELNRAVAVLSMERVCTRFYVPSAHTYSQHEAFPADHNADIATFAEHMLTHLLSTEVCEFILDGSQYTRIDKVKLIEGYDPAQKFLNVCTDISAGHTGGDNCSRCGKCMRTMCELDLLGVLDKFSGVFNTSEWPSLKYPFLCMALINSNTDIYSNEIIQLAKEKGIRIPYMLEAWFVYNFNRFKGFIKRKIKC